MKHKARTRDPLGGTTRWTRSRKRARRTGIHHNQDRSSLSLLDKLDSGEPIDLFGQSDVEWKLFGEIIDPGETRILLFEDVQFVEGNTSVRNKLAALPPDAPVLLKVRFASVRHEFLRFQIPAPSEDFDQKSIKLIAGQS